MSDGHNKRLTNLERDVASLRKAVNGMRKQDIAGIRKQENAYQENNATTLPILVERTPRDTTQAANTAKQSKPFWKPTLEIIGIVAGIGYALVTFFQWRDLKHNFVTDERAWVNVSSVEVLTPISTTGKGWFLVKLANTGKTPALREHLICAGALINGDPTCKRQPTLVYFGPVAPGGIPVGTTIWVDPQKQAAVEAMTKPGNRLHLKFTLEYNDIFGKTHHTTYCGFYPPIAPMPSPTVLTGCDNAGSMD